MRGANQHLSSEEIEQLISIAPDVAVGALEGAMRHLERCEQCRFRMLLSEQDLSRASLKTGGGLQPTSSDCPPEMKWLEVAAGVGTKAERRRYVEHAAACAQCGLLLKQAVEDVGMELTAEEETKVAALSSAQPEWQSNLVKRIADSALATAPVSEKPSGSSRRFVFWPRWAAALAGLIVATGSGWWAWIQFTTPRVDDLLAQAYTEQRTIEPRIPRAKYAPMRVERGQEHSRLTQPTVLLDAEAIIGHKLQQHPGDAGWLAKKGRAELLENDYRNAIKTLEHAHEATPDSTEIATDLASAYFERAQEEYRPIDYGTAIQLLGEVLQKEPENGIALFNRALVYEQMFLYGESLKDWQHYLNIDAVGEWADEAKRHITEIKQRLEKQSAVSAVTLRSPSQVAALGHDENFRRVLDSRIEEYLEIALREWLPHAFPSGMRPARAEPSQQRDFLEALQVLAITMKQHGDSWLEDLVATKESPSFSLGVSELSEAMKANMAGDPDAGIQHAHDALRLFKQDGNNAGAVRALVEVIYGAHRSQQGSACLNEAHKLDQRSDILRYSWIEAQLAIEESSCWSMLGRADFAEDAIRRALNISQRDRYDVLYLRALGINATLATAKGDGTQAWAEDYAGLHKFWSGSFPIVRAFQFYSDMEYPAEDSRQWRVALPLAREALAAIATTGNRSTEAIAHHRLAQVAMAAGELAEAEAEFQKASQLFHSFRSTPAIINYETDAEISLARLELEAGDTNMAGGRLAALRPQLSLADNYFIVSAYYQTLADVERNQGRLQEAEKSLLTSITVAEWKLGSIHDDSDRVHWIYRTATTYKELIELKLQSGAVEQALELWEWYRGAPLRLQSTDYTYGSTIPNPASLPNIDFATLIQKPLVLRPDLVQRSLPLLNTITIISYVAMPTHPVAWVYDNRGIWFKTLPVDSKLLEQTVFRFRAECADPSSDLKTLQRDGRQLYDWLIAPLQHHLTPNRPLVIESDEPIQGLPFQAMIDPAGQYIGSAATMTFSPGLRYFLRLRENQDRISTSDAALIVGAPAIFGELASRLPPLVHAAREAQVVASKFVGRAPLIGNSATLEAVERGLPEAAIFHFAGHAILGPRITGLVLVDDQSAKSDGSPRNAVLDLKTLKRVDLTKTELAVLSACSTERGPVGGLGDPQSLTRSFLLAGVPHVVAAHWNVDSAATAIFMNSFYDSLFMRGSVANALQQATVELMKDPVFLHPYYWAAFSAFGRT